MNNTKVRKKIQLKDNGKKSKDIFDLADITDAPESVSKNIHNKLRMTLGNCVTSLFSIKSELTIDEVVIGLWRKYEIESTRQRIHTILYNLITRKMAVRIDRGLYALVKDQEKSR